MARTSMGTGKEEASWPEEGQCQVAAVSCGVGGTGNPSFSPSCFVMQDYSGLWCRPAPRPEQ